MARRRRRKTKKVANISFACENCAIQLHETQKLLREIPELSFIPTVILEQELYKHKSGKDNLIYLLGIMEMPKSPRKTPRNQLIY